jgi:hypothetical protein
MDHFADIFVDLQMLGKAEKQEEKELLQKRLDPWTSPNARGQQRVASSKYPIKCVG